jgi:hypothetical protein
MHAGEYVADTEIVIPGTLPERLLALLKRPLGRAKDFFVLDDPTRTNDKTPESPR